jgi:hypothetical protein
MESTVYVIRVSIIYDITVALPVNGTIIGNAIMHILDLIEN